MFYTFLLKEYIRSTLKYGVIVRKPPMFWVLSTFHPNVWKQPPPPQCLTRSGGCTPTLLSRRAGSDVDATAAANWMRKPRRCHVSTGQNKKRRHSLPSRKKSRRGERIAEGSGDEVGGIRRREGAVAKRKPACGEREQRCCGILQVDSKL